MNICICTHMWLGAYNGAVDRILRFAKSVSKHGVKVFVLDTSRIGAGGIFLDPDKYYSLKNGILEEHQYPFYIRFLLPRFIKFMQKILNKLLSLVIRSDETEVGFFNLFDPYLLAKLLFVCKKERIDLIQSEFPMTVPTSFIGKKILHLPLIYDAHNVESDRIKSMVDVSKLHVTLTKKMETIVCRVCDFVFVVSGDDKKRLLSLNVPDNKIEVIPNSVDMSNFSTLLDGKEIGEKHKLDKAFIIIFHGTLDYSPNKEAIKILINEILPQIWKRYPHVRLLLVGKNPPKTSNPNVIVTGFVKNLPEYISAADIAVVPLLSGGGTRIKILEYMACRKSVVSTFKGAEGLNLQNGEDILMTENPDSEFIDLVFKLIEDGDLRRVIGMKAREKVELLYDWEKNAKKAVDIYNNLVN